MELVSLLNEYLAYQLSMGIFVPASAAAVRSDFRGFLRFLERRGLPPALESFNTRLLGEYIAGSRHLKGTTVRRWRKSFAGFARWAELRDYLSRNPVLGIEVRWAVAGRRQFMFQDPAEANRFLVTPIATSLLPEVDQVLRMLLLFGGLRRNEILKLSWQHVHLDTGELHIFDSKATRRKGHPNNFDRIVPIARPLNDALLRLQKFSIHAPQDAVLVGRSNRPLTKEAFYDAFHNLRRTLGYESEFVPHSLRHNLASSLSTLGATPADLALLLGHRSTGDPYQRPTTTDGYIVSCINRIRSFLERYAEMVVAVSCDGRGVPRTMVQHEPPAWKPLTIQPPRAPVPEMADNTPPAALRPAELAEAVVLWRSLYPGKSLTCPEFLGFIRALAGATAGVANELPPRP